MKSVQVAIESLRRSSQRSAFASLQNDREHAVTLIVALESRVAEHRGELHALEVQLDQAREMVESIDQKLTAARLTLHPTIELALRPFIQPLRNTA